MSTRARIAVLAAVVVVAVVAFIVAQPGGSSKNTKSTQAVTRTASTPAKPAPGAAIPTVVVRNAKPVGGIKKITVKKGGRVRFEVISDVADEIHVHGYDLHKDVTKGGSVSFDFPASIDGVFVIELEGRSQQIASLQVNP